MAIQAIVYTTDEKVRSVLGIDAKDYDQAQISNRELARELSVDLISWIPDHATLYSASYGTASPEVADCLILYSTYFCAVSMVPTLRLGSTQMISDGKNTMNRFSTMDWDRLEAQLTSKLSKYREVLTDLIGSPTVTGITDYARLSTVGLATDPVLE